MLGILQAETYQERRQRAAGFAIGALVGIAIGFFAGLAVAAVIGTM